MGNNNKKHVSILRVFYYNKIFYIYLQKIFFNIIHPKIRTGKISVNL